MRISSAALASIFIFVLVKSEIIQKNDRVLELIASAGYDGEVHKVMTDDGYFLRIHRLAARSRNVTRRKPVFLMHGIVATAADFLLTGPDIALAYLLADHGYDVWMGNARGSRFSTKHQSLSKLSNEFWTFSWHEIGYYDLPAMIDYMLEVSGSPNAFFAGHSQGTTALLVMLSTRPQYNQKIIQAHLMAPSAYRKKIPQYKTVIYGLRYLDSLQNVRYLDLDWLLKVEDAFGNILCREDSFVALKLCQKIISLFVGKDQKEIQVDTKILTNLMQYLSKRISIMQITHYYQNMISDNFQMFDHKDPNINLMYYNSVTPPAYNLKNVIAPMFLYHASADLFTSIKGVEYLAASLPNVKLLRSIDDWNHIDFVYGKNSRGSLYYDILKSFNSAA